MFRSFLAAALVFAAPLAARAQAPQTGQLMGAQQVQLPMTLASHLFTFLSVGGSRAEADDLATQLRDAVSAPARAQAEEAAVQKRIDDALEAKAKAAKPADAKPAAPEAAKPTGP